MKKLIFASVLLIFTCSGCFLFQQNNPNTAANSQTNQGTNKQAKSVQVANTTNSVNNGNGNNTNSSTNEHSTQAQANQPANPTPAQNDSSQTEATGPKMPPNAKVVCFNESSKSIPKGRLVSNNTFSLIIDDENLCEGYSAEDDCGLKISIKTPDNPNYYTFDSQFLDGFSGSFRSCSYSYEAAEVYYDVQSQLLSFTVQMTVQCNHATYDDDDEPNGFEDELPYRIGNLYIIDTYNHAMIAETTLFDTSEMREATNIQNQCKLHPENNAWVYTCIDKPQILKPIAEGGIYESRFESANPRELITYQECLNKN